MKKYYKILTLISLALMSFMPQGDQTLANVQTKYKSIHDFSADFSQSGGGASMRGKVYYQKEEKYRIELKNMTIVSDGKTMWSYNKKQNKVVVSQPEESSKQFSLKKLLIEDPKNQKVEALKNEHVGGEYCSVIKILPQKKGAGFEYMKIWANDQSLPRRIEVSQGGIPMSFELSNYKLNQNLSGSKFTFTAPKGCNIVDIR
jgi:outer membrane lipoprotein-sorting protein